MLTGILVLEDGAEARPVPALSGLPASGPWQPFRVALAEQYKAERCGYQCPFGRSGYRSLTVPGSALVLGVVVPLPSECEGCEEWQRPVTTLSW